MKIHDAKTGKLLMNDALSYGRPGLQAPVQMNPYQPADPNVGSTTIVVPYVLDSAFKNVDAYTQDEPERAVAALTHALQRTAQATAALILAAAPSSPVTIADGLKGVDAETPTASSAAPDADTVTETL
ncbi:hypothetical protein HPO_11274 [Hyphomonas polymorpha PS728]|uniref:Uncharacterized protein n=1 Tax=Hyphomonas polymorpha PS728 TaxID=1280954 RepID=A0A062VHY6_9PROT|nr:hypothetical protein [Hyphomonas polymorpha]KCZ98180.1 hypothetical protein HPO_11274 [Hyphomonas polymorpha PS728]